MGLINSIKFFCLYWSHVFMGTVLFLFYMLRQVIKYGPKSFFHEKSRSQRPASLEDPKLGRHKFLKTDDGFNLHYVESGDSVKPLMLLVHGYPDCWYTWRDQIPALQKNYRVVAVDTRGCGESDKPPRISDYRVEKVAGDLRTLIKALGCKNCIFVGHDWGGIVGWYFAHQFPEMTQRLIILNAPHPTIFYDTLMTSWQQRMKSLYLFFFQIPWLPEVFMKWNDYAFLNRPVKGEDGKPFFTSEEIDGLKYSMSRPGTRTASLNYYRANIGKLHQHCVIDRPTLVIWGMKDRFLGPSLLDGMEKFVRDLKVAKIEDAGHWVHQNRTLKVNQLILQYLQ